MSVRKPVSFGSSHCQRAFTLIELLVVVAIIALLISILIPSLRQARAQAYRTKCATNQRQIAAGWTYYLEDHNDFFMWPGIASNPHYFFGGKKEIADYSLYGVPLEVRPLNQYVSLDPSGNKAAELFHCPADNGAKGFQLYEQFPGITTYDLYGNCYPANGTIMHGRPDRAYMKDEHRPPLRLVDVRIPPSLFVLGGDQQHLLVGKSPLPSGRVPRAIWHDKEGTHVNLAFLDAHVAYINMKPRARVGEVDQTGNYSYELEWLLPEEEDGG
ncbi:MAG: prepilin-type N-terminal cleavage/methylation domain-containing protein [Phycisphaerae bacterium]|nr:prepilin-type N-terminal cleavage/methylation domain-containing protein [Phycisphaerae bacterium]